MKPAAFPMSRSLRSISVHQEYRGRMQSKGTTSQSSESRIAPLKAPWIRALQSGIGCTTMRGSIRIAATFYFCKDSSWFRLIVCTTFATYRTTEIQAFIKIMFLAIKTRNIWFPELLYSKKSWRTSPGGTGRPGCKRVWIKGSNHRESQHLTISRKNSPWFLATFELQVSLG